MFTFALVSNRSFTRLKPKFHVTSPTFSHNSDFKNKMKGDFTYVRIEPLRVKLRWQKQVCHFLFVFFSTESTRLEGNSFLKGQTHFRRVLLYSPIKLTGSKNVPLPTNTWGRPYTVELQWLEHLWDYEN